MAQDAGTEPVPAPDPAITKPALPPDLQELIKTYRHARGDLLRQRVRLIEKLKTCTDEERAALIAKFRAEMRESLKEQAQLRKQIRRELMQLRRERRRAAAGGG